MYTNNINVLLLVFFREKCTSAKHAKMSLSIPQNVATNLCSAPLVREQDASSVRKTENSRNKYRFYKISFLVDKNDKI